MSLFLKRIGVVVVSLAIIAGSFGSGVYMGSQRTLASDTAKTAVDLSSFWKAWDILESEYVPTHGTSTKITNQDKVYGAIKGLTESYGDPYTVFFPPVENKEFQTQISGNFEGVGMEVGEKEGVITIIAPLKDTPAFRAGILAGDKILKINGTSTVNMSVDQAVSLMRGKKGTSVKLNILHPNAKQPVDITIVRDVINIPTIETEVKEGVFIIHLYSFSENSANLFRGAIQKFIQSKTNKLVLDLRGNPGGYLEAAVDMASWFLPQDKIIVKEDSSGHGRDSVYKSRGYNIFNSSLKMVILVDGGSASASEILAGALQEHGIAKLVGTKTFGKGSVQELVPITKDTSLKVTIARWLTPKGLSISEQGLKPDYEVAFSSDKPEDKGRDLQMQKAMELLQK